jgi:hypothetical protein
LPYRRLVDLQNRIPAKDLKLALSIERRIKFGGDG